MHIILIDNMVIKGYHEFQIRPPPTMLLPVTRELGNKNDPNACLVWVPKLDQIPASEWNMVTDEKRGETVRTIAGLPIGRVPRGISKCFWELLGSPDINGINW